MSRFSWREREREVKSAMQEAGSKIYAKLNNELATHLINNMLKRMYVFNVLKRQT
jgi:uncharacterized protein YjgD (DUF1641 family)